MAKTLRTMLDEAREWVPEVDPSAARERLASPDDGHGGWMLLDVREPEEFAAGSVPGSINVPRGILEVAADHDHPKRDERLQNRHRKLLVLCAGGNRSLLAARTLQQMGFQEAVSVRGGYAAWSAGA